jgi:hypothetical protein
VLSRDHRGNHRKDLFAGRCAAASFQRCLFEPAGLVSSQRMTLSGEALFDGVVRLRLSNADAAIVRCNMQRPAPISSCRALFSSARSNCRTVQIRR